MGTLLFSLASQEEKPAMDYSKTALKTAHLCTGI